MRISLHHNVVAIILAGGDGARFGCCKQYSPLRGKAVIYWPIKAFLSHPLITAVLVVIRKDDQRHIDAVISQLYIEKLINKNLDVVYGDKLRHGSCFNGLVAAKKYDPDFVLIHDAVRPILTQDLIDRVADALEPDIGVIPGISVSDTIKCAHNSFVQHTIDRSFLYRIQTPQGFCFKTMQHVRKNIDPADCTDDAELFERAGKKIKIVPGHETNIKITYPGDLILADLWISDESGERLLV